MSLQRLKNKLAIDQRNIISGEVLSTSAGRVTLRSDKNEVLTALTTATHAVGDQLQVRVDGSQREVIGSGLRSTVPGVVVHQFDSSGTAVVEGYALIDDGGSYLIDDDGGKLFTL